MFKLRFSGLFLALSFSAFSSATVQLKIEGSGQVKAQEANVECAEDCNITVAEGVQTLTAQPSSGWLFEGWIGSGCVAGNGVMVSNEYTVFDEAPGGSKTLDSADINGDGLEDFAAIELFGGKVTLLTNNGDGTFTESENISKFDYPSALTFYDWDADGDQDLLVTDFDYEHIKVFENDGNGEFSLLDTIEIEGVRPYAIAVADVNKDGSPDLLLSSFNAITSGDLFMLVDSINDEKTHWYLNEDGGFVESTLVSEAAVFTLDVHTDENGVITGLGAEIEENQVVTYHFDGDNVTKKAVDHGGNPYGAAFGDIDNNGTPDVLATYYRPTYISFVENEGDFQFALAKQIGEPQEGVTATAIADLNNDGLKDLAVGEFNNDLFYYFSTISYRDCLVDGSSETSITAKFVQDPNESQSDNNGVIVEEKNDSSSSGGSSSLIMLLGAFMLYRLRKA